MELISKENKVLAPMVEILDIKNINNCIYYSDINPENERRLFIDVSKLSFVNRTMLYAMAEVYMDTFSFGDVLVDSNEHFVKYTSYSRKDNYPKHNIVCFSLPNFGSEFDDYTTGFYLAFANCFVKQEPIPVMQDIYTKEEFDRYKEFYSGEREELQDIVFLVSLGKQNPLQNAKTALRIKSVKFRNGEVVSSHGGKLTTINKNFTLTTDKALSNYTRYNYEKEKAEKAKQKAKTNGQF
mgnify:CR=1 FL=1